MTEKTTEALHLLCDESDTFVQTVESLRRLVEATLPHATSLDANPRWQEALRTARRALPEHKQATFIATVIHAFPYAMAANVGGTHPVESAEVAGAAGDWEEYDPLDLLPDEAKEAATLDRERLREVAGDATPDFKMQMSGRIARIRIEDPEIRLHFWALIERLKKDGAAPSHQAILARSVLAMAVSAFEVLVGSLFRAHITANPSAADDPNAKTFSLADLYMFGSVEDAVRETIIQQSDRFSRKGIRAWAAWFAGKPLLIDLQSLAMDWPRLVEIFERRNVVVHNGSRVTRQYLANVDERFRAELSEGDPLEVDPDYIDAALTHISVLGTLISVHTRMKVFSRVTREGSSEWINAQVFDLLSADRFEGAEHVASAASSLDLLDVTKNLLRVNGWIAKARLHGLESIRRDVTRWDTSALTLSFRTAQQVLLDRQDTAVTMIRQCLREEAFGMSELLGWPLFHWLREAGALDELMQEGAAEADAQVVELPASSPDATEDDGSAGSVAAEKAD